MLRCVLRAVLMVAVTASAIKKPRVDRSRNEVEEELETWKEDVKSMEDKTDENGKITQHLQARLHRTCSTLSELQRKKKAIENELPVVQGNSQTVELRMEGLARTKMDLQLRLSVARKTLLHMDRVREKLRRECFQKEETLTELHSRIQATEREISKLTDRFAS